jgi:hypothetical protein
MLTKEMIAGAIGQIGIAISSAFLLILAGSNVDFTYFMFLSIIDTDILIVSFIFLLVATVGIPRKFRGSSMGILAALLGIPTGFILLAIYIEGILGMNYLLGYTYIYYSESIWYPNVVGLTLIFISDFFFGCALLALGGFFLSCRASFVPSLAWVVTGIAYLAAAVFQISLLLVTPSYMILVVAGIIGAFCMLISRPKFPRK